LGLIVKKFLASLIPIVLSQSSLVLRCISFGMRGHVRALKAATRADALV
jgi:hypothetical protein